MDATFDAQRPPHGGIAACGRLFASALVGVGLLLAGAGCQTTDGDYGRSAFGESTASSYGETTPVRVDARTEAARLHTRTEQLEAMVRRLQTQVDGMTESQSQIASQSDARLLQARQEAQSANAEVDALRRDVAALRAEQQQLRKAMDDLPARVSKAVAAVAPAAAPSSPRRSTVVSPANAGGAAVGYEHVVEAGQTLSEIAHAYKVRVDAILKENKLKDANSVRVGQKLFIPKP